MNYTKKGLMKHKKEKLVNIIFGLNTNNTRVINRLYKQKYQVKVIRMKLKRMRNNIDNLLKHPYSK